jgi:hypothetical protein
MYYGIERDTLLEVVGLERNVAEASEAAMSLLNACSRTLNRTYFCIFQWQTVTFNKSRSKGNDLLHKYSSWWNCCCE